MRRHAGLVLLSLTLAACSQQANTPTATSDLQWEAEAGTIQAFTTPQTVADPRNGGRIINDPAASGGKAVILLGTNDNVRFVVPGSVKAGRYTVSVRGKGEAYKGWPTVDLNDERQRRLAVATLDSATYVTRKFGEFDLKPGQVFNLSFINDLYEGRGKDRNAVVDYLVIEPVGTTPTPPANQAPTVTLSVENGVLPAFESDTSGIESFADDNNIILNAGASDPDGKIVKVEFYADGTKIGEDMTAPYSLVLAREGDVDTTFATNFTARAIDHQGAATTSDPRLTVSYSGNSTISVSRAINFGGPDVQIQSYEPLFLGPNFSAGEGAGITTNGTSTVLPTSAPLSPTPEPDREALVRSALSRQGGLEVNVPLPNASYEIYLWVRAEDATAYDIRMEGQTVGRFDPGAAGQWKRLGPINLSVGDGVLNVASTGTATANFSAIEVYRRPQAGDTIPTVTLTLPASSSFVTPVPAGQPLTLAAESSDPDGIARVEFFAFPYGGGTPVQKIGEATSAPYTVVWRNTPTSGLYNILVVATDNAGVSSRQGNPTRGGVTVAFSSP
ncbi:Ig-like domain-containing protein [Deinococcus aestuarii]|uniref:Ig-like domain-containing protein n=1 Tax=Deinococcus aestuarii TaxID=2774531 RepID=UPI001C0B1A2F|nr:Ig-like domain-containing protein [Deinococcus aestuarii]